MMRRLLSTRRHLPLDRSDDYLLAWVAVARAVQAAGGRAWIFRGSAHEDHFMEFIEWDDDVDSPADDDDVAAARTQLDAFATPSASDEWEEAS
ncbi:hypothetical protein BH23GEM9_BH23GEM9_30960 [soil metagenome]